MWLRQLLGELHQPPSRATVVYCDNINVVYMSSNPVQHQGTKNIEIDLHFMRERVALGEIQVLHVPTSSQFANIFTKGLPTGVFLDFRSNLNVDEPHVSTAGGVGTCPRPARQVASHAARVVRVSNRRIHFVLIFSCMVALTG